LHIFSTLGDATPLTKADKTCLFFFQEATGVVLVSQKPTKIILYWGWTEGEEKCSYKKRREESKDMSN